MMAERTALTTIELGGGLGRNHGLIAMETADCARYARAHHTLMPIILEPGRLEEIAPGAYRRYADADPAICTAWVHGEDNVFGDGGARVLWFDASGAGSRALLQIVGDATICCNKYRSRGPARYVRIVAGAIVGECHGPAAAILRGWK